MKILSYPDQLLLTPTKKVVEFNKDLENVGNNMLALMSKSDGVGLAANQVGLDISMFVTNQISDGIIVNPTWKPTISGFKYKVIEGCLSFAGWIIAVERYDAIYAEWQTTSGEKKKRVLTGFMAQVFQHETEHTNGKTFLEHLSDAQVKTIKRFYDT